MRSQHPVTASMLFVIAVVINGAVGGLVQGLSAAVLSSAIYTFFIRFPVYARGIDAIDDMFPIVALTITATFSGVLSGRLTDRATAAEQARSQLGALLRFSSELQSALDLQKIIGILASVIPERQRLEAMLAQLARENSPRDIEEWNGAAAGVLAEHSERFAGDPANETGLGPMDERAIFGLASLAVERSFLLQEQTAAAAAVKSEALKTALLSSLSHDLLTPLAAIATSASGLRRFGTMLDEESKKDMLATIEEQCARLEDFAGKLISLGRVQGGLAPDDLDIVDLGEAIGTAVAQARLAAPDQIFRCDIPDQAVLALVHPALLDQVLRNVIENAVRYGGPGGDVSLRLVTHGGHAELLVTDMGPGLPDDELSRVFTRFYRGTNAAGRPGHGLGLSIAKAFVESLGGSIGLTSRKWNGRGTQVRIVLPAVAGEIPEPDLG